MKFFIPHAKSGTQEALYGELAKQLKSQLGILLEEQRIFKVTYQRGKRKYAAEVGKFEEHEDHYEIIAIYKTPRLYIVATRTKDGEPGVSILVDKDEVLTVEDFADSAAVTPV